MLLHNHKKVVEVLVNVVVKVVECLVAKLHFQNSHRHIIIIDHEVPVVPMVDVCVHKYTGRIK